MKRITYPHWRIAVGFISLILIFLTLVSGQGQEAPIDNVVPPEYQSLIPEDFKEVLTRFGGNSMFLAAKAVGVTTVLDKDLTTGGSPPGEAKAGKLTDVGIGDVPLVHENEPTVAANPKDKNNVVAGNHFIGVPPRTRCVAYNSFNNGATWSAPILMPQLTPRSSCSDPVLAFAPDGSRVYYAYMDIKSSFSPGPPTFSIDFDIVVSFSDDGGQTWTGPVVALNGTPGVIVFSPFSLTPGFAYDKPWIGTHIDASQSNFVYVTATRFGTFQAGNFIDFARSAAKGVAWSAPTILDAGGGPVVVQGSRPVGGVGGEVLVAWYNSGTDGWLQGTFKIRTRRSPNNGATFGPIVDAVTDSFEAPFFLGPFAFYHRWWAVMFPDVEIDPGGEAHIAYTHDPVANLGFGFSTTPEDGDIRYISSPGAPYTSWSVPVTVNDDGTATAQGYAALETQHSQTGRNSTLHLIWEDHRLSAGVPTAFPNSPNIRYDMFYSRNTPGRGSPWFSNFRVTEVSSISDFLFLGDYNDLSANTTILFGVFTDRRHQASIFAFEDNTFGSLIISGGAAP